MPRKSKDEELNKITKKVTNSKNTTTKSGTKKASVKASTKKVATKTTTKSTSKKATKTSTKSTRATAKKPAKITTKKVTKNQTVPLEYYDLPTSYDKTVVKILAQTPSCLFVYWEVSKSDKQKLQKQYGEYFFNDTKPYLVVINETMNYSFELEINDYANSWYISIQDSSCKYNVKLIRKPINHEAPISTIDITSSNETDIPNDHILFDKLGKTVFFKNTKTDVITEKDISSISLMSNIGRIYNIYDLYKEIYQNELNGDELGTKLSSSQFSSTYR